MLEGCIFEKRNVFIAGVVLGIFAVVIYFFICKVINLNIKY